MHVPENWLRSWFKARIKSELAAMDREIALLKKLVAARDIEIEYLEKEPARRKAA